MGLFKMIAEALGWSKRQCKIIVVGLDNSGKSTLINHLKPKKAASYEVAPTVGFSEERFEKGKLAFQVFDMSGAGTYRSLWESYYKGVDAVIFVVDSTDRIRMAVAKDELEGLLGHRDVAGARIPVLLYANKMDLPAALEPPDIMALLGLQSIAGKPWHIQASNALSGDGVDAGITWLADQLSRPPSSSGAGGAADAAASTPGKGGAAAAGGGGASGAGVPPR